MYFALVTGASGGLGSEIGLALLKNDVTVFGVYNNTTIRSKLIEYNNFIPIKADISKKPDITSLVQEILTKTNCLDYLINAAGITHDGLLIKYSESDWDRVISINLSACFYIIREALPLLRQSSHGHIINISSISGIIGRAGQTAYSASKAGLIGMSLSMAREFAEFGIRVNVITPGYMQTSMGNLNQEAMKEAQKNSLINTLSKPEEAAEMILNILNMNNITGQIFNLDSRII
ncbi:MAG: SDR family oxidoreductase [Nitrospirae bacterium]|nr:SDR family oxidoreductase [Nitrospirota bacterium]